MINELMDEYYNENARYATKEEAVHNLLAAVLCQAVFDYRKELFLCIGKILTASWSLRKTTPLKTLNDSSTIWDFRYTRSFRMGS